MGAPKRLQNMPSAYNERLHVLAAAGGTRLEPNDATIRMGGGTMPEYILTFDLGTTGNKAALIDREGNVFRTVTSGYGVDYPKPGWASQRAEAFIESCAAACRVLLEGVDPADIVHGLWVR